MGGSHMMKKTESLARPIPTSISLRLHRSRRRYLGGTLALLALFYYLVVCCYRFKSFSPYEAAGNSTLGFQSILVLSKAPSWRTRGLIAAAEYTGIDIQIPKQPHVTVEMIQALRRMGPENVKHPEIGEASNWLAHLDLVKFAVASDLDTTLIIEDDVDWDVSLRSQMPLISKAVREFTYVEAKDTTPYGSHWDILWIGHSGEHTGNDTRRVEFADPATPPADSYIGWSKEFLNAISPGHRAVQRGDNPVGTFAYGLSRRGAEKVLRWAGKGENEAFDIRLMEGCKEKHLSCLVINPEIMHHYVPPEEFGHLSTVAEANGRGSQVEDEEFERVMGSTRNIVNSARCRALFGSTCQAK